MTEKQWVTKAKKLEARPPMPAVNVRAMSEQDLKAVYHYVKSLGPAGSEAPDYVPPTMTPNPPYVQFPSPPGPQGAGRTAGARCAGGDGSRARSGEEIAVTRSGSRCTSGGGHAMRKSAIRAIADFTF